MFKFRNLKHTRLTYIFYTIYTPYIYTHIHLIIQLKYLSHTLLQHSLSGDSINFLILTPHIQTLHSTHPHLQYTSLTPRSPFIHIPHFTHLIGLRVVYLSPWKRPSHLQGHTCCRRERPVRCPRSMSLSACTYRHSPQITHKL